MIKKHEYPRVDWFEVVCDNCQCSLEDVEENTLFPTYTDAQNTANEEGWETLENDTHYCEICRIEDK